LWAIRQSPLFFLSGYSESKLLKGSAKKEKQEVFHKVLDNSKEHV
jgi:hypothetical protein